MSGDPSYEGAEIMDNRKPKRSFFRATALRVAGALIVLLAAVALLWHGNANSMQAAPALVGKVHFEGEYRIADGAWQTIVAGEHISSTKGDVTLRGNFHFSAPDGTYVGIYSDSIPIALYTDHINLTFYEYGSEPFVMDMETPSLGSRSSPLSA